MSFLLSIACLVTLTGLALGGFTSNAFIIAVIVTEWVKSRSLNSSALLYMSLGMSNICCTASVTAIVYREHFKSNFRNHLMSHVINIFLSTAMLSRFWLNAWLCIFYCIKIVNSTNFLFLWCKQRISWLLPWTLVASAAISIFSSIFAFKLVAVHLQSNTTTVNVTGMDQEKFDLIVLPSYEVHLVPVYLQSNTSTVNITDMGREELEIKILPSFITFFLVIGSSCPLFVVFLCSIVIVASLYKHVCQMTGKESSFRNPQTKAHFKAAGTVLFLLFLYLSSFIAQILTVMTKAEENMITFWLSAMVIHLSRLSSWCWLTWCLVRLKQAITWMLPGRKT